MASQKNAAGLYQVEVDGRQYEFEKWGAEESLSTLLKLSKIAGKPLAQAIAAIGGDAISIDTKLHLDAGLLSTAISALMESMDEGTTVSLIKKLSSEKVLCDGAKISFNSHYQDRLDHLFKVVAAALEVQYGNFFGALLGLVGGKRPIISTLAQAQ
jgi:hypothetical protein